MLANLNVLRLASNAYGLRSDVYIPEGGGGAAAGGGVVGSGVVGGPAAAAGGGGGWA